MLIEMRFGSARYKTIHRDDTVRTVLATETNRSVSMVGLLDPDKVNSEWFTPLLWGA